MNPTGRDDAENTLRQFGWDPAAMGTAVHPRLPHRLVGLLNAAARL
jgi:hypothetical protein